MKLKKVEPALARTHFSLIVTTVSKAGERVTVCEARYRLRSLPG